MTNYKRIAVEVGDLIKWDVSEPTIGRMGAAVFSFTRDSFPNDSITSVRARAVYDWVLTLARQKLPADVRDKRLAEFCVGIAGDEHRGEVERILLTNGVSPSIVNKENHEALIGRDLHPEVVRHARELFVQGHFFHAVFEAAKAYNKRVREKAQSSKDGQDLMLAVWGCEKGVLKISACESETDHNVQDGVKFLSAGLMRAIRNPTAHEPAAEWPISRADSLDILSFLSFLFRKLDDAVYHSS
ncbi:MAG: TIGR02391 family protein [Planctomycetes bacterium]|nr:TIGR02391 family protein [Planctomycetota bacterium]